MATWVCMTMVISLVAWSCGSGREEPVREVASADPVSVEADEPVVEVREPVEPRTLDDLLEVIPDRSVIWTQDEDGFYFGTFYLDETGIRDVEYASSAARIEIQQIERTERMMTVYYLFQFLGTEVSKEVGPERFFTFTVTAAQVEALLPTTEDLLVIDTVVTEITRDDIP
jgi:hypothetical protein